VTLSRTLRPFDEHSYQTDVHRIAGNCPHPGFCVPYADEGASIRQHQKIEKTATIARIPVAEATGRALINGWEKKFLEILVSIFILQPKSIH